MQTLNSLSISTFTPPHWVNKSFRKVGGILLLSALVLVSNPLLAQTPAQQRKPRTEMKAGVRKPLAKQHPGTSKVVQKRHVHKALQKDTAFIRRGKDIKAPEKVKGD